MTYFTQGISNINASTAEVITSIFNEKNPIAKVNNGNDGLVVCTTIASKNSKTQNVIKNSSAIGRGQSPFENILPFLLEPKEIPFAVKATIDTITGYIQNSDVSFTDIIAPMNGMQISGLAEKFIAPRLDYGNFNLEIQSGMNPQIQDNRQKQVDINDVQYDELPLFSYASQFTFSRNEEAQYRAHNILGKFDLLSLKYQRHLRNIEQQYQYDMVQNSHIVAKNYTLLRQEDDAVINNLGIPNNVNGLADPTLTATQFNNILMAMLRIVQNKNNSIRGLTNAINTLIIPQANRPILESTNFVLPSEALSNIGYRMPNIVNRFQYLVSFFQQYGITVYCATQFNPSSSTGVYDSAIQSQMNPASAIQNKNKNHTDRPFYLFTNDNKGTEQSIMYAPKISFLKTGFVNVDPYGQIQGSAMIDIFSGIKYRTPALNRALITTNN